MYAASLGPRSARDSVVRRHALRTTNRILGPALVLRQRRRHAGVVLLYHRVGPQCDPAFPPLSQEEFERHLDVVTTAYEVVPLEVLVQRQKSGRTLQGLCSVTFDDGYRDFLEHAYPVLMRRQVPATHFLVSDCVETGRLTWNYRLNRLQSHLGPPPAGGWKTWLGTLPRAVRDEWLLEREQSSPSVEEPSMIRTPDLADVDERLVHWGSHSVSHPMLGLAAGEANDETRDSRSRLRDLGAGSVTLFAYPNGSHGVAARSAAADAGYAAAFGVGQAAVNESDDPFAMGRFDVGGRRADELLLEITGALQTGRDARRAVLR